MASLNGSMRLIWAQLWHQSMMRCMRTCIASMKMIKMHVGSARAKIWFGVRVCKGKSITSISAQYNLTSIKNINVDVNIDVIVVMPKFMQQDWAEMVGEAGVGQSSYSSRVYFLFEIYCSFSLRHVTCRTDTIRLVIRCSMLHAS
jgi:hypothetical protein